MPEIRSEMAGVIDSVLISVGDEVKVGQKILVVESMKTVMDLVSEHAGKVEEVKVEAGDFIEEGDVLLSLNSD